MGNNLGETPVAIRFPTLKGAVVALELPYSEHDSTAYAELVICRQDEIALVIAMIKESHSRPDGPLYSTGRSFKGVQSSSWDDLVFDEPVLQLVKGNYESFFAREDWFRGLKRPFRRGYLFHGPPGNGKTSVIRAMLSRRGMRGLTLNFFAPSTDNCDLQRMFERAAEGAPSMVVLEDIDRAFPRDQASETKSKVSLQQLLNCLDGIGTQDGVIVVATANEPTALDPAILRRPGRFDRVVLFPNPSAELRLQYLRKLNCQFEKSELKTAIDLADGFSFAQMREVFILEGQRAIDRREEIECDDILSAVQTLRYAFGSVKERQGAAGFGPHEM
jgi:SpoVK/Ycf46/Vps4 family AAA+-type ATPase